MKIASGFILDSSYQIIEELGSGAMGTVYSALDLALNRKVAIKLLHLAGAELDGHISRFEREGRALSKINQENVIKIYKFGYCNSGIQERTVPYFVMEFLEGETLKQLITRRLTIPGSEAISIITKIALAMIQAHLLGIIHRDLKPQNIFMAQEAGKTILKVLDFGLCKETESSDHLTGTGYLLGSAHYMSPECCAGRVATPESDIYSLGVILYELLTGSVPYNSDNPVGILYKQIHESIPIIARDFPHFPNAALFDQLLKKCLAKDPHDRYRSMDELLIDLLQLQSKLEDGGSSGEGGSSAKIKNAKSNGSARKAALALFIVILLALAAFAVISREKANRRAASRARATALTPETFSQLQQMLATIAARNKSSEFKQQSVDYAIEQIDNWLNKHTKNPKQTKTDLSVLDALDLKGQWLNRSKRSADASRAEQVLKQVLGAVQGKDDFRELRTRANLVDYYNCHAERENSIYVSRPIFEIWRQHKPKDSLSSAEAYRGLCWANVDDSEECCRNICTVSESLFGTYDGNHIASLCNLIDNLRRNNKLDEAKRLGYRVFEIAKRCTDVTQENKVLALARTLERRADVFMDMQQFNLAYGLLSQAESTLATIPGTSFEQRIDRRWINNSFLQTHKTEDMPVNCKSLLANLKFKQGQCLLKLNKRSLALRCLCESESLSESLSSTGVEPTDSIKTLTRIAVNYAENGFSNDLLRVCERLNSLGSDVSLQQIWWSACDQCGRHHPKVARQLIGSMLQCQPQHKSREYVLCLEEMGEAYGQDKEYQEAVKWYDRAELMAKDLSENSLRTDIILQRADCLQRSGALTRSSADREFLIALARKAKDPQMEGLSLCHQALITENQNKQKEALVQYQQSLKLIESGAWAHSTSETVVHRGFWSSGAGMAIQDLMGEYRCYFKLGDKTQAQLNLKRGLESISKYYPGTIKEKNKAIRQFLLKDSDGKCKLGLAVKSTDFNTIGQQEGNDESVKSVQQRSSAIPHDVFIRQNTDH